MLPDVEAFTAAAGRPPGLGIVLVGDDPASEIYVRNKVKAGADSGLRVDLQRLPATRDARRAARRWSRRLNASEAHDGILVQSPLPAAMGRDAAQRVFDAIDPAKDVDGFIPVNVGRLVAGPRRTLAPCTPSGVIEMLDRYGIPIAGARAVVIGRSDIVGKPMAMLLLQRDATVTICHSRTPRPRRGGAPTPTSSSPRSAGPGSSRREFVKPGATVIDVGINRVDRRGAAAALFARGLAAARRFRAARLGGRRRRAPGRRRGRRRAHAGAGRRRPADDRHAAEEHGDGGAGPRRRV